MQRRYLVIGVVLMFSVFTVSVTVGWAARQFLDATTDRVQAAATTLLPDVNPATWAFWIYSTGTPAASRYFARCDDNNTTAGWWLEHRTDNIIQAVIVFSTANVRRNSSSTPTQNVWTHVAITWDGGTPSTSVKFFFNGVKEDGTDAGGAGGAHDSSSQPCAIGNDNLGGSNATPGYVADFRIYDAVLTDGEVVGLMSGIPAASAEPIGWWPLCGRQSPEPDQSGRGNNGVVTGTAEVPHPTQVQFLCLRSLPLGGVGSIPPPIPPPQLALFWSDPNLCSGTSPCEDGFHIYRRQQGTALRILLSTVGKNVGSYVDTSVGLSTVYCYTVRAYNQVGESADSNEACGLPGVVSPPDKPTVAIQEVTIP